jgi:hypothetical protein
VDLGETQEGSYRLRDVIRWKNDKILDLETFILKKEWHDIKQLVESRLELALLIN